MTVTIPSELVAAARERVKAGDAPSLSALLTEALADRLEQKGLAGLLDELDAEFGKPSAEDEAWARRVLGL